MNKKLLTSDKKTFKHGRLASSITLGSILFLSISACSNSCGNNAGGNGNINTLQIITPRTIYSNPTVANVGYVVINNPTNTAIKNLHYSLNNIIGGAQGTVIDPASAANCSVIESYGQCNLKVTVPIGAVAGSLGISLNNENGFLSKLNTSSQSAATPTIGIQQSAYNDLNGADGITLNYYHTVINGTAYILVSGLVASANAGNFNNVVLVDSNNIPIPNQQLIAGSSAYTQGKTFSILLPVSSGNNLTQVIKAQTQLITSPETKTSQKKLLTTEVVSTATISSTLTTVSDIGIVEMLPSAIYLNQNNPEQLVTFSNTGSITAQLQSLTASNPNIEVIFSSIGLISGGTTTAILKLKDPTQSASSGEIVLTYYNGQREVTVAAAADQNVNPTPSPAPTPTPTPSPTPTPVPTAGLTAVLNPNDDFFVTTANGTTSRQLTISNTGNTNENNFVLTLPNNFTIGAGSSNSCTVTNVTSPASINNTLTASGGNCTVMVTYTNSTVTTQTAGSISIAYGYNNGIAATPVTVGVNYKVTRSTANLSLSPSTMNYASIPNNDTSTSAAGSLFTLSNSGEVAASNLAFNITGTNSSLFSVVAGGNCLSGGTLGTSPATCTIATMFGPAANGVVTGTKTASFAVSYTPYTGGATQSSNTATLSGAVTAAPSATYTSSINGASFISGGGTSDNQYTGYINTNYTLGITYTNDSAIDASGFTTSYTPPAGWTLSTHGCDNVAMAATNGTCTDIYTLNSADAGSHNLLLQNLTASWTDSSGTYNSQPMDLSEEYVTLTPPPAPPTITINNLQGVAASVMGTSPITFTATISGSGTSTVSATLTNFVTGVIVSDPSPCALDTAGVTSCGFNIIPWYTGFDNSTVGLPSYDPYTPNETEILLSTTAGATISGSGVSNNSISYIITTPYVYLPAPMEGAASESNTGITWGSGGSVSTRFEAGTADGGGDCPSGQEVVNDNLTGLMWVKAPSSNTYTWANAQTSPAIPATYCGYTGWRLPTETELLSLVNYAAPDGNLASWLITQGFTNIQGDNYWSATPTGNNNLVWILSLADGSNGTMTKSSIDGAYVWPVRSR